MGFTPLEGLVMGTRCGDVDPGLVLHLIRNKGMTRTPYWSYSTRRAGFWASRQTEDIRDLEPAAARGDRRARLALEVQAYRVRKSIGAYAAALGGLDAITLSGALAENSAALRGRVLSDLEFLGIRLDGDRNRASARRLESDQCRRLGCPGLGRPSGRGVADGP